MQAAMEKEGKSNPITGRSKAIDALVRLFKGAPTALD